MLWYLQFCERKYYVYDNICVPGTLLSERQSTYYTDASDVFTVVSMPLAVTWQAFALLTEEKSPATHLQWEQKCQFSVK